MKGAPGGFTIFELMMVLAISALMLGSAFTVFSDRRDSTSFSQSIYDLQSQFRSIANNISSQAIPGLQQYSCSATVVGGVTRPVLSAGGATQKDCIYLGQALQIINTTGTSLYSYPVFGLRTTSSGDIPTQISDANPSPAIDSSDNLVTDLIGNYVLAGSVKTKWAKVGGNERDLIGLYSNASESNTSGNEVSLYQYDTAYNSVADVSTTYSNIKSCVRGGCSMTTTGSGSWQLCLSDGTRSAIMNAFMSATGVNTSISFKNTADCT